PSPLPNITQTPLVTGKTPAKSSLPSPLKSPATSDSARNPAPGVRVSAKLGLGHPSAKDRSPLRTPLSTRTDTSAVEFSIPAFIFVPLIGGAGSWFAQAEEASRLVERRDDFQAVTICFRHFCGRLPVGRAEARRGFEGKSG